MVDDYMLDKALDKIKGIIGIEKIDGTKILIETDDKLPNDISLKAVALLLTWLIKNENKFYLQIFLEEALLVP